MTFALNMIRFVFFILSTIGIWELIRRKTKVNIYFIPSLTVALQTCCLFFGGLLCILWETTELLYLIGIIYLAYVLCKENSFKLFKNYANIGYLFLGLGALWIFASVFGKEFMHYDNFSHWALVVKQMVATDRFPNFQDEYIWFQQYPLGSSVYVYFLAALVGKDEFFQMFAQGYIILAALLPVFYLCKNNKKTVLIIMLIALNFFLTYNILVTDLLVDTVMPVVAACGVLYIVSHINKDADRLEIVMSAAYMLQVVQIKNSGIFFCVIMIVLLLMNCKKLKYKKELFASCIIPFVTIMMWSNHCRYAFIEAEGTKHAMSIMNYSDIVSGKDGSIISRIISDMYRFSFAWKDFIIFVGVLFVILVVVLRCFREQVKNYMKLVVTFILLYIVYQAGVTAMYIFSMPTDEALVLASVERYSKSLLLVEIYILLAYVIHLYSSKIRTIHLQVVASCMVGITLLGLLYLSNGKISFIGQQEDNNMRIWLSDMTEKYDIESERSYLALMSEYDGGLFYFMGRYLYLSDDVTDKIVENIDDIEEINSMSVKYIFVMDKNNELINAWINERYPEQYGNDVIVTKKIN